MVMRCLSLALSMIAAPSAGAQINNPPTTAQVQSQVVTLNASGDATWTFAVPFPAAPDVTHMPIALDTVNPLICNYVTRTTTAVTIHCWRTSLSGLLTGLLSGPVTGAQINLIARYRAS